MRPAEAIKKQPPALSEDKTWFLGHLAGDGGFVVSGRRKEVTVYAGVDQDIAAECVRLFREIYGANSRIVTRKPDPNPERGKKARKQISYEVTCSWSGVVDDLLTYAPFGITRWRVPQDVARGTKRGKALWVSGFADAEGHVAYKPEKSRRNVTLTSSNEEGLRQVSALLDDLDIRHGWAKPRRFVKEDGTPGTSFAIYLSYHKDLEAFAKLVGFRSPRKQATLIEAISTYKRKPRRTEDVEKHLDEVQRRRKEGETHVKIAAAVGLTRESVAALCYRHGIEPIGREGNADGGRRSVGIVEGRKSKTEPKGRGTKSRDAVPRVIALRKEGKGWKEIGRALGHEGTDQQAAVYAMGIVQWAKKRGLWPEGIVRPRGVNAERIPRIVEMRKQGMKLAEIGRALGLGKPKDDDRWVATLTSNIIRWAKKRGLWPDDPPLDESTSPRQDNT